MTTAKVHMTRIEDHEGEGRCSACQREGLRWVVILSDGTGVGTECAKAAIGHKPTPRTYSWVADYTVVAERTERAYGGGMATYTLWQHKAGTATRETCNGSLTAVGGVRATWAARGWL